MTTRSLTRFPLAAAAFSLALAGQADAAIIAAEQVLTGTDPAAGEYFAYPSEDGRLTSGANAPQNPANPGFSGGWGGGGTSLWRVQEAGLDHFGIANEAGGAFQFSWNAEFDRRVTRAVSSTVPTAAGSTLWMSTLVQMQAPDADGDGIVLAGFADDATGASETNGVRFGLVSDGAGGTQIVVRHRADTNPAPGFNGADVAQTDTVLGMANPGQTYLILAKIEKDVIAAGDILTGNDRLSLWLDPQVTSGNEADLGAPDAVAESFAWFNPTAFDTLALVGVNWVPTGAPAAGEDTLGVLFDEMFLGETLADVAAAVPEPSRAMLMFAGLAALAFRRRR
ncbi:MAG: PEP-CTERM sorting domain-containing protein [Verrucomicrobiales bacterium]